MNRNARENIMRVIAACGVIFLITSSFMNVNAIENYHEAKKLFWKELYPKGYTLYCRAKISQSNQQDINIEHVFPMAWVKNSLNCGTRDECRRNSDLFNRIEADMHNLYPSLSKLNYERQAFRFGTISGEERRFGPKCDFEVSHRYRVVEPRAEARGEIARAMFYMEKQYEPLVLFKKQADILLKWHEKDPPSKEEKWRNDKIEALQGNRNPFIDDPSLIQYREQQ